MKVEDFDAITSDLNGSFATSENDDDADAYEGEFEIDLLPSAFDPFERSELSDEVTTALSAAASSTSASGAGVAEADSGTNRDAAEASSQDLAAAPPRKDDLARSRRRQDEDHLFRRARQMRHSLYTARPYGILGLYHHLCDLRSDRAWARDAAARRRSRQQPSSEEQGGSLGDSLPNLSWTDYQELAARKDGRGATLRLFTNAMLLSSTALLIASFGTNGWKAESMRVNPMAGPSASTLLRLGALRRSSIVLDGEWYRILTAIPLHAGILHWLINGLAMWWLSRWGLRPSAGFLSSPPTSWGPVAVFVAAAVAGNVLSAAYSPFTVTMGASGGMFGWLGYCAAEVAANARLLLSQPDEPYYTFPLRSVACWLAFDLTVMIVPGLTPFVDNFAHMGGFLAGLGVGWSLSQQQQPLAGSGRELVRDDVAAPTPPFSALPFSLGIKIREARRWWTSLLVVSVILMHAAFLARSDSNVDVCVKCRYLSCVPFPFWTESKWWHCDSCDRCPTVVTTDEASGKVWLDVTCPYGDVLNVPVPDPTMSDEEIMTSLVPRACRESCSL